MATIDIIIVIAVIVVVIMIVFFVFFFALLFLLSVIRLYLDFAILPTASSAPRRARVWAARPSLPCLGGFSHPYGWSTVSWAT